MTDNFELFNEYINKMGGLPESNKQSTSDRFYNIELIRRGKDNPDMSAANVHFKNYYIYSWEDYSRYEPEIKLICDTLRLRAYVSVNFKSTKQIALNTLAAIAKRVAIGDFKKIWKEWESQTGLYSIRDENVWLLDIDDTTNVEYISKIKEAITKCRSKFDNVLIMDIPTRSGIHILTRPFDLAMFDNECVANGIQLSKTDIKKNHITLLYENL